MTCFGAREECSKAATQILKQRVTEIQDPSNSECLPHTPHTMLPLLSLQSL